MISGGIHSMRVTTESHANRNGIYAGRGTIWCVRTRPVGKRSVGAEETVAAEGEGRFVKLVVTKHPRRCMHEDTNRAVLEAAKDTGWGQGIGTTVPCY